MEACYYTRARNLHKAAQLIRDQILKVFPTSLAEVEALPGIGRSTAGAILSLACNQAHPILDGNVKRVLARFHAVEGYPGQTAVQKQLWRYAEQHLPTERNAAYAQAMMDLGATLCTRSKPDLFTFALSKPIAKRLNWVNQKLIQLLALQKSYLKSKPLFCY